MGFMITNKEGKALLLEDLDIEAREFWHGTTQDWYYNANRSAYAVPTPISKTNSDWKQVTKVHTGNWFDIIGFNIHKNEAVYHRNYDNTISWEAVKESIAVSSSNYLELIEEMQTVDLESERPEAEVLKDANKAIIKLAGTALFCKPYFQLIDHWKNKGYKPLKVQD